MKPKAHRLDPLTSELLILPNGRILVHNLTQPFAELLRELNPNDGQISPRVETNVGQASRLSPSLEPKNSETGATPVLRCHELPN
jgi:hypothetical protein